MQKGDELRMMSRSMAIVMVMMMLSKIVGFLRETVLAAEFGLNWVTDAYKAAYNLPAMLLSVVVAGLTASFIPVYNSCLKRGEPHAQRFTNNIYTVGLAIAFFIAALTWALLGKLVPLLIDHPQTQALTIRLAQMMIPMGIFVLLHRVTTEYLQARFQFGVPAIAPLFNNLCVVIGILLSRGNIYVVAFASLLGMALHYLVQVPKAHRLGLRYRPVFDLKESGLREVAILMLPVIVSSAFEQIYAVNALAVTSANTGDISALDYGNRISTMISAVALVSIATVLYPSLVRDAEHPARYSGHLTLGLNLMLLIALPATAAMILLRVPVTQLVYERGAFTSENTLLTAATLGGCSLGLIGVGVRELCNRSFYALKNMKIPTIVGVCMMVLNMILNYLLYPLWRASGVALATSVSSLLGGATLLYLLHRRGRLKEGRRIITCLWKTLTGTGVMCVVLFVGMGWLQAQALAGMRFAAAMLALMGAGLLAYVAVLLLLRTEELRLALRILKRGNADAS